MRSIGPEAEAHLDWLSVARAIEAGHDLPAPVVEDTILRRGEDTLLNRSAWIDGLGMAVKVATVVPGNAARGLPAIGGGVMLFDDATGALEAVVDFHLVTKWKTAADSLLGALKLARPDSRRILIVGAGTVAASLRAAYGAGFPDAAFQVWNRTPERARALAEAHPDTEAATDLAEAVAWADIVTCATMSATPVIEGAWLRPGQHLDLIGAYRPDMREADDVALGRARLFCDARATTIGHIGEFADPIARGVIDASDIVADFRDGPMERRGAEEITLFKNGGGAHLDLMVARHVAERADAAAR
ncbi:MAG: ornithine cyclodeaminase family protein [Paracoccaceae bacterium]